jgi:hypothetical protein
VARAAARVWCCAFAEAFMLLDDPAGVAVPVRWDQVIEVTPVWTEVYRPAAEESRPTFPTIDQLIAAYARKPAPGA